MREPPPLSVMVRRSPTPALPFRALCAAALLGASLAVAAPAYAQASAADRAAAEALFDQAVKLLESGDAAQACPKLEESQRLDPGVGTLLYLGDCYSRVGRSASAWATFREAEYAARSAGQSDRERIAKDLASRLEPTLAKVTVTVAQPVPEGLVVRRGSEELRSALLGTPVPVDAGEITVTAEAPGYEPYTATRKVADGDAVTLEVPALAKAATPAPTRAPDAASAAEPATQAVGSSATEPAEADRSTGSGQRTLGWILTGVGGAGLVTGGVFAALASSDDSAANDACRLDDPMLCDFEGVELADRARSKANAATIIGGVGLAAATAGLVLVFTAPSGSSASTGSSLRLSAALGPDRAGLGVGGAW